jgi:leucyl/phenylalanyl-tRNA---protein transferase
LPVYLLDNSLRFPPVQEAEEGIVAVGGDLAPERLLSAYQHGIFPWYSDGEPIIWWSPDPRFVLMPDDLHISSSMQRVINSGTFTATFDTDFDFVIRQCAVSSRKGQDGTWITNEMIDAYNRLHHLGYAHSVEVRKDNRIVGGMYGISLGKCFFGESMFFTEANASKFAFIFLVQWLKRHGFHFLDAQVYTTHVASLGAKNISRDEFMQLLKTGLSHETWTGKWNADE